MPRRGPTRAAAPPAAPSERRVRLSPHGLDIGDGPVLPLWAGAMHYWRHPQTEWRAGLEAMRAMGLRLVDTYVPWGVHETSAGGVEVGGHDRGLGGAGFLELAHHAGPRGV